MESASVPDSTRAAAMAAGTALEDATFAFADLCADPSCDVATLIAQFHEAIALAGFAHAVLGGGILVDGDGAWRIYFNSMPADWMARVEKEDWLRKGLPGNNEVFLHMNPFEIRATLSKRGLTPLEQEGVDFSSAYGWRTSMSVPLHGPMGYRAAMHVAAKTDITVTPRMRAALWSLSQHLHERCHAERGTTNPRPMRDPGLTWRELECLQLVSCGLTDKQIGRRLGISPETVSDHVTRGCRRLKVRSRVGAAAMLALMGKNSMPPDLYKTD